MLFEPTMLAATSSALAEAVETYGCDARDLFDRAGVDISAIQQPGARYPVSAVRRLWQEAVRETGDPAIGISVGERLKPTALYALGHSWIASPTIIDGLRRVQRYAHVSNTILKLVLIESEQDVRMIRKLDAMDPLGLDAAVDACLAAIIKICRTMSWADFAPTLVTFVHPDNGRIERYIEFFKSSVRFESGEDALHFDPQTIRRPVPVGNVEVAYANDRLTERYLSTLDSDLVQDKVRRRLLDLLPSGAASQETVASSLNRSVSALQRQLKAEGISYWQILEETREMLALRLVRERQYSLSQVAYLLGFSDQANFTRAFRRWTGSTPSSFRARTGS
jgi:AraC-like DNA-binding protein